MMTNLTTQNPYDHEAHYKLDVVPIEYPELDEYPVAIENIGWTIGNDCPYRCNHCYSMSARRKGMDLEPWMIDKIINQLLRLNVKTVNLGGNEPIFTSGLDVNKTLLPYIIESLVQNHIDVGLTTSGISLIHLQRNFPGTIPLLNDIDISFDSPFEDEHNKNRGASLYQSALKALRICQEYDIDRTIIMAAMSWNFSQKHIDGILELARVYSANIRVNPLKPVQTKHMEIMLTTESFYDGLSYLMSKCDQIDLGEPILASACSHPGQGCPCGRTSFRIHSITPDGKVPVSPCVYLHDYKVGDLLADDIFEIIHSHQFRSFRRRVANPQYVKGCKDCGYLSTCRGGCAARSYLINLHTTGNHSLFVKDPYCLRDYEEAAENGLPAFPQHPVLPNDRILVHRNYLCTWIGKPKAE